MIGMGFLVYLGVSIIRIGFGGPLYYNYDRSPQNSIGNFFGPYIIFILQEGKLNNYIAKSSDPGISVLNATCTP